MKAGRDPVYLLPLLINSFVARPFDCTTTDGSLSIHFYSSLMKTL